MSATQQIVVGLEPRTLTARSGRPRPLSLRGSDTAWAIAFVAPYVAVFVLFVIYPVCFGLWMGHDPSLYRLLFSDPKFRTTLVNTLLFVGIGVNLKMFLALLLSGFFVIRSWWVRALLAVFEPDPVGASGHGGVHLAPFHAGKPMGAARQSVAGCLRVRWTAVPHASLAGDGCEHCILYLEMDAILDTGVHSGASGHPARDL